MPTLKAKEIKNMSNEEKLKRLKELKLELIKSKSANSKSIKTKQIKKIIARILTLKPQEAKPSKRIEKTK